MGHSFTLWMVYCCPALDGESYSDWEKRAKAEYELGEPSPLPECQYFDEQGTGTPVQGKVVK